ncbi:hypothetical protein [uncultured Helicobacter sp.]|uniref:ADP-ribosyltransferase-containing protein n=1 Tax=uncultured Helicobacter sp. TaxID=175537 RepID=UPI00374E696B
MSKQGIDEVSLVKVQSKFNYDEKKAKDLLEWHEDSSPITKDKDGLPKVFYHGTRAKPFEVFKAESGYGIWTTSNYNEALEYTNNKDTSKIITAYIKAKNPFMADNLNENSHKELKRIFGVDLTDEILHDFSQRQQEFQKALKETKRRGYILGDIENDYVNIIQKDGTFLEFTDYLGRKTRLLDKDILKRLGLPKIAKFVDEDSKVYIKNSSFVTSDIDLLMDLMNKYDYGVNKSYLQEKLKKAGYDSIKMNDNILIVFDSNQIKHIDNKGSYIDSSGNITSTKPKNAEAKHKYFNEASPNIYYSNSHIGTGLASGTLAGVETDEEGNIIGFDPSKFALGFLGGATGSVAVSKGFKLLKEKPELKEALKRELADTLSKGWENATDKYPLLKTLEPVKHIMQGEKGRIAQANHILNKLEQKEAKGLANVTYNGKNASLVYKDLENIDEAILYAKGNRYKGAKHIRIEHLTDSSKEGYVRDKELLNLGKDIREFLKYNEPFIDKNGARLYEWENKEGVRFRVVVNDIADMDSNPTTATEEIITFYSDRNLKERMKFKNFTLDYDKSF